MELILGLLSQGESWDDLLDDYPDPEIDAAWAGEVRERRAAYQAGRLPSRSHTEVMSRYRRS